MTTLGPEQVPVRVARPERRGAPPGALEASLRRALRGEVLFDPGTRAIYATDSSNYRHVPIGVVCPLDEDDVRATLRVCGEHGAPIVARGGGTSLAGQACNAAVVIDMSRHMNAIIEIDPARRLARVQPGVVLDDLRAAAERHGLTFGPDPATHGWCTIGGMIGNNSCGAHALYGGKTVDNVESLHVLTYRGAALELGAGVVAPREPAAAEVAAQIAGELADLVSRHEQAIAHGYPALSRRVSGYNLDQLRADNGVHVARAVVGSESTCVLVTEATLRLVESPPCRRLALVAFPDIDQAADAVPHLLRHRLLALEGLDDVLVAGMRRIGLNAAELALLPEGAGWLLAELGGRDDESADAALAALLADLPPTATGRGVSDPAEQRALWKVRDSALAAAARAENGDHNLEGWEDAAVPPENLGTYLRALRRLWADYGYHGSFYGHFGQGCVHTRNNFDFSSADGIAAFRSYVERAARLCVELGGSISGEHGDGQARGELLSIMYSPELISAFGEFKAIFDPDQKMNPGRLIDAAPLDQDLRLGPGYRHSHLTPTMFAFAEDGGSLQLAAERCVGVGRCRGSAGVMCPSFRATGEEKHSTRGRAKLLSEMFRGEVTPETWRNEDVREALELCLSCKGCAVDCPTSVDMATYKAEFLSHYYRRRLRPAVLSVLGLMGIGARLGAGVPGVANALLQSRTLGDALKRRVGVTTARPAPRFAPRRLRRDPAVLRAMRHDRGASVVLFPDTFSDAFAPGRGAAALAVLEAAGERVVVPSRTACCGRPLYDAGMLSLARLQLRHLLDVLAPFASAGLPIVVPEPSCLAAFRDELPRLLADDPRAAAVARASRSLAEHLETTGWTPPVRATGRAVIHPHCHQRAVGGSAPDVALLERCGFAVELLDAGCCGLAGAFGYDAAHEPLSRKIAADAFLPALRGAGDDAELVIDGFSCRLQAEHHGERPGRSLAEVLARLLDPAR